MTEDEREELVYRLVEEFKASVGSVTDQQRYAFISGARAALVAVKDRLGGNGQET